MEETDPTGSLIEPVDPAQAGSAEGGLPARPLLPDRGWGSRPADLEALLKDKAAVEELEAIRWKEVPRQPGPEELGRPLEKAIPAVFWKPSPGKVLDVNSRVADGLSKSAAIKSIESEYKQLMGISPKETMGVLKGPDGEIIKVSVDGLAHAMLDRKSKRERFIHYFRETIEAPYEILLTEYKTPARNKIKLRKKYIGLFKGAKKEGVVIVGEITPEGWAMWNVMNARKGTVDRLRRGVKILYGSEQG